MVARRVLAYLAVVATVPVLVTCVDATHDDQVQALGSEVNGVPPGPNHRPGQPCLVCHGGQGPASGEFTVAGTVYAVLQENAPAVGASVLIEDITGATFTQLTNEVGNFYITPEQWQPTYPTGQIQVSMGSTTSQMLTHVGRDGSCGGCHQNPAGPASPGLIYVNAPTNNGSGSDGGADQ